MDKATKYLSDYIYNKGINIKRMSDKLNLSYDIIYNSLGNRDVPRPLRGDELLVICDFLEINPLDVLKKTNQSEG